jgi:hypothetical protein
MKCVIICGSRHWADRKRIEQAIKDLHSDTLIVHGGCRGADRIAGLSKVPEQLENETR